MYSIITLDNSKWVKDYDNFFFVSRHNSKKINNTQVTDEIFVKIFDIVNSIIVVFPSKNVGKARDISYKICAENEGIMAKVKELLNEEDVKLHSSELHELGGADCRQYVHYFDFTSIEEIGKFMTFLKLDKEIVIKVYTTLMRETREEETKTVNIIDNSNNTTNNSSVHSEVNMRGNFNRLRVNLNGEKGKGFWSKFVNFIFRIFRMSS